ncbi:MAG TPA: ATP-binding cassette domain-containing protein [Clostridiales bacterium]|nr:ATP-binding cassette domain-containing protein [Clostridiales bacterium]
MLKLENLTKAFGDAKAVAVNNLTFEVGKGEIFGLLGENGAGKTTTLRMMATMLKPTSGTGKVSGFDIIQQPEKVRSCIGILFGGESGLYDRLTAAENIAYFGELYDMDIKYINERIAYLSKIFGMEEYIDRRASRLSKGMRQKTAFARAIVHNPDVMLFDEPTSGLDVGAIREVHDFIRDCGKNGKTIILSSHSMGEVEKLCDRIGIIHKGNLVDIGTIDQLKEKYNNNNLEEIFIKITGRDNK